MPSASRWRSARPPSASSRPGPYESVADRARPRGGDLAGVPARARRPRRAGAAGRRRGRAPELGGPASCPACQRPSSARPPPTARGPRAPARRRPRSPARRAGRPRALRARVRAPGAARLRARAALRPAGDARRRRPLRRSTPASWSSASRTTRRRSPPSACCCRRQDAARAPRARWRAACGVPLAALDRGFAVFGTPGADRAPRRSTAVRSALKL